MRNRRRSPMYTCSTCGFAIRKGPLPTRCPRCGTHTDADAASADEPSASKPDTEDTPIPPPPPAGFDIPSPPEAKRGKPHRTIFGMPPIQESSDGDLDAPADAASEPPPQPTPEPPEPAAGPPALELDDDEGAPALELDDNSAVSLDYDPEAPSLALGDLGDPAEPEPPGPQPGPPPPGAPPDVRNTPPAPRKPRSPVPPPPAPEVQRPSTDELDLGDLEDVSEDIDLPAPKPDEGDLDLPMPAGSGSNLPAPGKMDLPTPKGGSEMAPKHAGEVAPKYGSELEPTGEVSQTASASGSAVELDIDDLEPSESTEGGQMTGGEDTPRAVAASDRPAMPDMAAERPAAPPPTKRRPILLAAAAVVLLAGVGGGLYATGYLDGDAEQGATQQQVERDPAAPAQERSEAVLASMAADTPAAYRSAMETAEAQGDPVGQAEAALLLHLRYGPEPVLAGQAESWLEPRADQDDPFVQRVVGLAAMANGELDEAGKTLAVEDRRARIYRSWLALRNREHQAALEHAKAVIAEAPEQLGAVYSRHAARTALGIEGALEDLKAAVKAHAEHPLLRMLLAERLLEHGHLARAITHADAIETEQPSDGFRARVLALQGRIAAAQGDRAAALLRFDQALELAEADTVRLERVRVLMDAKDFTEAAGTLDVLLQNRPDWLEALLLQAELAIATGKGDQALETLDEASELDQDDPRIPHLRGQVHAMRMAVDEARQAFAQARELEPGFHRAAIAEAEMLAKAEQLDEALPLLEQERERMADQPGAARAVAALWLAQARLLETEGRTDEATTALNEALQHDPDAIDALLMRGSLRLDAGEIDRAREDLELVYARTRGYPGLAGPLGRIHLREGNLDGLRKLLEGRLDDPRAPEDIFLLGARLRLAEGKLPQAKALVDRVLGRMPGNWEAHLIKAQLLLARGDAEGAQLAIEQARPRTPDAELELWTGKILEANDQLDQALAAYAEAVAIAPQSLEARYRHGRALALRGAAKQAIAELEPVVEATEAYPGAWMALGLAYRDQGQTSRAIGALGKATELDPSLVEAWYWKGRLHADQNQHGAAITALTKAVENADTQPQWLPMAYRVLGRSLAESGQRAKARAVYQKFLQIAPPGDPGRMEAQRRLRDL